MKKQLFMFIFDKNSNASLLFLEWLSFIDSSKICLYSIKNYPGVIRIRLKITKKEFDSLNEYIENNLLKY